MSKDKSIVIVGTGVFGLSAAYHLTQNGYSNIKLFDRINHEKTKYSPLLGSDAASGDINKFFRIYYETKTLYSKLGIQALDIWEKWNEEIQKLPEDYKKRFIDDDLELIRLSAGLRINDTEEMAPVEKKNLEGFEKLGLRSVQFDIQDDQDILKAKLLGIHKKLGIVEDLKKRGKVTTVSGTLDGIGRMLKADKACYYIKILLEIKGVDFFYDEAGDVDTLLYSDKKETEVIGIKTKDGKEHKSDLVITSAGPWTPSLVTDLKKSAQASLANIVYLEIPKNRQDLINKYSEYPHTQWKTTSSEFDRNKNKAVGEGGFAFFPPTKREGILKINTRQTKLINPLNINDTYISVPKTLGDEKLPKTVIQEAKDIFMSLAPDVVTLPGVKLVSKLLWYTDAVNSDFIIDFVPGKKNLLVSTGGSSHGFKFLPVTGQFVVDKIECRENDYTRLFRWKYPTDISQDNYGLLDENIEHDKRKNFDLAEKVCDEELYFSKEDLSRLESVTLY